MPYALKPNKIFAKDPNGTGYLPQNVVTDNTTADIVSQIKAVGTTQKNAVNEAGETKLNSIETAGENHLEAINSAGTTQTNAVNTAGTTQANAVNAAGKTQTDAIDAKSAEIDQKMQNADSIIDRIDAAESLITELQTLIDLVHPVGSIYISLDSTDPGQLFGGTWEAISGRFLLGVGAPANNSNVFWGEDLTYDGVNKYGESVGVTGGTSRTELNEGNLPEHAHRAVGKPGESNDWVFPILKNVPNYTGAWTFSRVEESGDTYVLFASHAVDGHGYTDVEEIVYTGATGNGTPHNNMPPYLAVYMWKRTA